jgi:DNA-binding CsgD family transcriptional regulator
MNATMARWPCCRCATDPTTACPADLDGCASARPLHSCGEQVTQEAFSLGPGAVAAGGVEVPAVTEVDEGCTPGVGELEESGLDQESVRLAASSAGNGSCRAAGGPEPAIGSAPWVAGIGDVGRRHEQGSLGDGCGAPCRVWGRCCPARHGVAAQAVGDQDHWPGCLPGCGIRGGYPFRLARTHLRTELARAHLLYGEWLRRQGRRVDAREPLRAAYQMLQAMGAGGFAERARRELQATGQTVRKRTPQPARAGEAGDALTTQEAQVARLACEGLSNPQISTRLFISPRTVQYHLRKVFTKLGITSRGQLHRALPGDPRTIRAR